MRTKLLALMAFLSPVVCNWAASVTVNQSGSGDYTNIQAAINSGATTITVTDSAQYFENLEIGAGSAVTLTSTKTGTNRPVVTPNAVKNYIDAARNNQGAGFGILANNSVISNLVFEAQPDFSMGAVMVMATNVLIANCVFRIPVGTTATLPSRTPLLFFAQEGDGSGALNPPNNPIPGG